MSWPVGDDGGARRSAMVCFILVRVSTARAIAGSTSHSVCHSTCCEWLVWRRSGASQAQSGRSPASETDRSSTVAGAVAAGLSAMGFIRILRSRQIFSLFRLSGAATRLRAHRLNLRAARVCARVRQHLGPDVVLELVQSTSVAAELCQKVANRLPPRPANVAQTKAVNETSESGFKRAY